MLRVGLTGGIATGKSYVLGQFRRLGVPCVDADELAHGVMAAGTEATTAIADRFGDVIAADGSVDRGKLGAIVFADPGERRDLEAIVHPAVRRAITAALRGFELTGDPLLAMVDIPLLFETGRPDDFAKVVATVCDPQTQQERLRARGLTAEQIAQRLAAQMPADEKARRADYVIRTDGTFDQTDEQVEQVLAQLAQFAAGR